MKRKKKEKKIFSFFLVIIINKINKEKLYLLIFIFYSVPYSIHFF